MRRLLLALATFLTLPVVARADIPPPPDFEETCTVAKQSASGRTCSPCRASFRDFGAHCAEEVGAGFTRACRSWGASVWTEVWCQDGAADAGTVAATDAGVDAGPGLDDEEDDDDVSASALVWGAADAPNGNTGKSGGTRGGASGGGCSALDATAPSLSGLVMVAGWLATRLRRRRPR
ncbi:MAG: hypothetical protein ABW252_13820 [Polyangiales bacterium]